jgi:hypothetical protein
MAPAKKYRTALLLLWRGLAATPGRPVLTVVPPWTEPDHRRGIGWRLFQVRQAAGTARWRVMCTAAAMVAMVVPRVAGEAWAEGFGVALHSQSGRTWRQHLDSWRQGNELAHEIVCRRHGQRWDGKRLTLCCPFVLPDPAALSDLANQVAQEQLAYSGAARAQAAFDQARQAAATPGGHWRALRRIGPAVAVMATAAVAADSHRVTGLAPLVATRRVVVAEGRHVATPGHPGRPRAGRIRTPGRHARPRWRSRAARWIRDVIRWHERGAHRADRWPLRAAA